MAPPLIATVGFLWYFADIGYGVPAERLMRAPYATANKVGQGVGCVESGGRRRHYQHTCHARNRHVRQGSWE